MIGFAFSPATEASMSFAENPSEFPVTVDPEKCIADKGCTICVDVCPLDVLRIHPETGKAHMKYDECWYCLPCELDCPTKAITVSIPYLLR
jgi:NAD-dependent dihydropyrimidine dehydrogenase PreA subunit